MTLSLSELAARRLRRDVTVEQGEAEYTARRARLVQAATAGRSRLRPVWRWLLVALVPGSLVGWYAASVQRAITFSVGGTPGRVGAFYTAPPGASLELSFGDGSQVRLTKGSHARVLSSELARRALVLELGSAEAKLQPRAGWSWELAAGPFLIRSAGADLAFSWNASEQTLALDLRTGAVLVQGPGLAGGRSLSGPERLLVQVPAAQH